MRPISEQVRAGTAPQLTPGSRLALDAVPVWSPYRDWADAIELIAVIPTAANAAAVADRCERAAAMGPTPYLLARCATALQVAGRPVRASNFANTICRIYVDSRAVLAQAMELVARYSPAAADLKSTCVSRVD